MSRAYGYGQLNAKLNTIEALALAGSGGGGGGVGTLAQVMALGNVASTDLEMGVNNILIQGYVQQQSTLGEINIYDTQISLLNKTTYNPSIVLENSYNGNTLSMNLTNIDNVTAGLSIDVEGAKMTVFNPNTSKGVVVETQKINLIGQGGYGTSGQVLTSGGTSGDLSWTTVGGGSVGTLAEVMTNGNTASTNLDMNQYQITNAFQVNVSNNIDSTSTMSSQQLSVQKSGSQLGKVQLSGNGALTQVQDISGNFVKTNANDGIPYVQVFDNTNNKQLQITPTQIKLGVSGGVNPPPADNYLGTDVNGDLIYLAIPTPTIPTLEEVLTSGNNAGSLSIDMSGNNITAVAQLTTVGSGFNGLITSQDLSFASDTTLQGAGMSTYADGANSFVQDVTGSFIQLQSSSDVDFAPYDKPMLQIVDVVANAHLVLTSKQLRLGDGGETSYPPDPPADSFLGTDISGNLEYKSLPSPTVPTLSQVLTEGNTAGSSSIVMNSNNITSLGELSTSVIGSWQGILNQDNISIRSQVGDASAVLSKQGLGAVCAVQSNNGSTVITSAGSGDPNIFIQDGVDNSSILITNRKLCISSSSAPANSFLATDNSGNLTYSPVTVPTPALTTKANVSIPILIDGITYYIQIFTAP